MPTFESEKKIVLLIDCHSAACAPILYVFVVDALISESNVAAETRAIELNKLLTNFCLILLVLYSTTKEILTESFAPGFDFFIKFNEVTLTFEF